MRTYFGQSGEVLAATASRTHTHTGPSLKLYGPSGGGEGEGGIPSFLRDHLFVTTRVAVRDGNFLIGAPFVSDRPRHLFVRPKKSVLGPLDLFVPFLSFYEFLFLYFFQFVFGGDTQHPEKKKNNLRGAAREVGPWPYGPNDNPSSPTTTL